LCVYNICIFNFFLKGKVKDVEENILDKFYEYQKKADIYYAYHAIAKYMVSNAWYSLGVYVRLSWCL